MIGYSKYNMYVRETPKPNQKQNLMYKKHMKLQSLF